MEKKLKVWDLAVRLGHWAMAALVLGAFLTADEDETLPLHMRLGLLLLGIVAFRLVWGFVGSRHARFSDFVRSPRAVLAYARQYVRGRPGRHLGHNPLGSVMVLALLGTLLLVTVTGLLTALGPEFDGPLSAMFSRQGAHAVEEVHEASAWLLPWLVVLHVGGVLLSSVLERQNLVGGMVTGRKRPPTEPAAFAEPPLAARLAGFVMALVLGGLVVSALWRILPEAEAAEPQASLLAQYRQEAQAAAPAFQKEDPARGKALYFTEHERNGKRSSCASCHTKDARQEGRTPVGKRIDALAPSANPQAFTERKKADKWFDRNCKQVLGRTCSPGEKADFLAYLLTL